MQRQQVDQAPRRRPASLAYGMERVGAAQDATGQQ
jgi:hypothetical protein